MSSIVYLRLKKHVHLRPMQQIRLADIAYISTMAPNKMKLAETNLYQITKQDKQAVVLDSFQIIEQIHAQFPDLEIQLVGPTYTIVNVEKKKHKHSILLASFVWILLFIGTAMTIMNFHYDVSMLEVQQKLHFLFTGRQSDHPLWIQIPYSFGLGIGMLLFFNHWFKKRFNEEPSPLEIELFQYQQSMDEYMSYHENALHDKKHLP
ncbi:stage V sporulation protein AA [Ornithinibacillus gellani]|uniref:stage V sporulation protein AA n=1 Tax=Ornithinibacillus gellani TaxID=2293253 RepID=UPI000F474725|nr:stage V sporulation protein AA [Ornithinibacillus gellani]TQS74467.1 stage V sporulation protein AA [Ornithinibacillus gellani]